MVIVFLSFSAYATAHADYLPLISLGTDPLGDVSPYKAYWDILESYYTNDGTYLRFEMRCNAVPNPSDGDYHVYLDLKDGGDYSGGMKVLKGADYVFSCDGTLWKYSGGSWISYPGLVSVQIFSSNKTISFTCKLSDLGYPSECVHAIVKLSTHSTVNAPPQASPKDQTDTYTLSCPVISEVPLIVLPPFLALLVIVTYHKFKKYKTPT